MDNNFKDLLCLYACAINGVEPDVNNTFDFDKIAELANRLGIFAIIMPVLKKYEFVSENTKYKELYSKYLLAVIKNSAKLENIRTIFKQFEENEIKYCVLKGESLAGLYAIPETRISGDVDILIDENNEEKALDILVKNGFKIEYRTEGASHNICFHPNFGYVELHVRLYYDFIEDVWFDNIKMIEEDFVENFGIKTLGYTDGYLHVLLHAAEHFIVGGVSLRHFSDVLLYAKKYKDKIDFQRVEKILKRLKYDDFEKMIYFVGSEYYGITGIKNVGNFKKEIVENIFADMLKGGIFGKNDKKERSQFFETYNEMRFSTYKNENFSEYMTKWRRYNAMKVISFSKKNITKRYPYAKKNVFCYMGAMLEHSLHIIKKAIERKKIVMDVVSYKTPKLSDSARERLDLLKKMKML